MPREGAAAALREEILDRLEQVSVLVLLPVFFVVSGLSVNLSSIGLSGLVELCLILLVAVVGKFGGAFIGASLAGLTRDGIAASDGPPPSGAIVVAAAADSSGDAHLTVRAGTREGSDGLGQWVQNRDRSSFIGQRRYGQGRCARASTDSSCRRDLRRSLVVCRLP